MSTDGQCLVNPYQPIRTPFEELGVLPDTPSYYIEREYLRGDSIIRKVKEMSFHNYDDKRIAIYQDDPSYDPSEKIISLYKLDDSLWRQTSVMFYGELVEDTLYVWLYNGKVHKAITQRYWHEIHHYRYNPSGQLIQKTIDQNQKYFTDCRYTYEVDKLVQISCTRNGRDSLLTKFTYTDTLVTSDEIILYTGAPSIYRDLIHLDTCGNKLRVRHFDKDHPDDDFKPSGTIKYTYHPDGSYSCESRPGFAGFDFNYEIHPGPQYWERIESIDDGWVCIKRRYRIW